MTDRILTEAGDVITTEAGDALAWEAAAPARAVSSLRARTARTRRRVSGVRVLRRVSGVRTRLHRGTLA